MDPRVHAIMVEYGADQSKLLTGNATGADSLKPRVVPTQFSLSGKKVQLMFDIQPTPIEVPHRSISSDYQQTAVLR